MDALFQDLQALAREKSREKRTVLLRRLTDLFFRGIGRHDDRVLTLFEDVICRVLAQVDDRARAELSDRMAIAPGAPHKVVVALAEDELPIAEPVLRHSPALTDADLVQIAEKRGGEHLEVISRRIYVSESVTDTLIARGGAEVHRALVGNQGAQISEPGYREMMRGVGGDHILQELMALRPNLPDAVRMELLPMLATEVRLRVVRSLSDTADSVINDALNAEIDTILERVNELRDGKVAYSDLECGFDEGALTLDEALQQACDHSRHDWVIDLLSFAGPLDRARVVQTLLERDPKPIAVLLKALGAKPETFRAVLELRAKRLLVGSNNPRLVDEYVGLDQEVASSVLRHLRVRLGSQA